MKRFLTVILSLSVASAGCTAALAQGPRVPMQAPPQDVADINLMTSYVRQLPLGSRVRVALADGTVIHGTLMKTDDDPIVVQRRTRIPETPLQIPIRDLRAVELEKNGNGVGRAVAVGAATGAGAALGLLLVLAAIFAGD
jgi:hypothetical protein